jgi:N-carbamoyl-L-amino-acid hydrolase
MKDEARLSVRIDPVGNLIGRRQGRREGPSLLLGSHLDTVRGGGRFDGVSGVVAAIEVVRRFTEKGVENVHPIEIVAFLAEEPSSFGLSTIGSRGMAGKLTPERIESLRDETGRTLGEAIREAGGDPSRLDEARRSSADVLSYLELHIEQGPCLDSQQIPIGVVTGIAGIVRGKTEVIGRSDHSGTTPMDARKDALAAGAEAVLSLERVCRKWAGVVGTVGSIDLFPNATNVVPGRMTLYWEVRSLREDLLALAVSSYEKELRRIREERGVEILFESAMSSDPIAFDPALVERIAGVCERLGIPHIQLASGAGHDASHVATIAPTAMIFIPSKDGRSHCPEEWTDIEHIGLGTEVLACTTMELDRDG